MKIKVVFYSGHTGEDKAVCVVAQSEFSHLMNVLQLF